MASEAEDSPWRPSTDAQALANIRSLIRSYIRGELSHSAFVLQFGIESLTHDVATPRPPEAFEAFHETFARCSTCGYPVPRIYTPDEIAGCGCEWCAAHWIGGYRGHPEVNTRASESKAPE